MGNEEKYADIKRELLGESDSESEDDEEMSGGEDVCA